MADLYLISSRPLLFLYLDARFYFIACCPSIALPLIESLATSPPSQTSAPRTDSGGEEAGISSWPETVNANAAPVTEYHHRGLKSLRLSRPL